MLARGCLLLVELFPEDRRRVGYVRYEFDLFLPTRSFDQSKMLSTDWIV